MFFQSIHHKTRTKFLTLQLAMLSVSVVFPYLELSASDQSTEQEVVLPPDPMHPLADMTKPEVRAKHEKFMDEIRRHKAEKAAANPASFSKIHPMSEK